MKKITICLTSLLLLGCIDNKQNIPEISGFESWKKVTEDPIPVPENIFTLCRSLTVEEYISTNSPHRGRYIRVSVNKIGEAIFFKNSDEKFPIGSVVVKEKLPDGPNSAAESMGIMYKTNNGWQYIYKDKLGKVIREKEALEPCDYCHSHISGKDQVFRTYFDRVNNL